MARQPTLTVNVNSQQFQQFAQQFNALSGQIRQLNSQFQQISNSINRSNIAMRAFQATVTGALNVVKSLGSEVWKITKNLVSWSTIIGGITALLGAGGSIYGIERLAASIMQKRRQALGLGQDYGRTQASAIFNQSLMGSPLAAQQKIALGMHGAYDEYQALIKLGVDPTKGKTEPQEIERFLVKRIPEIMNMGGPGRGLMYAENFGLTKFFDPMTLMRLSTKEGQKEYEEKQKLIDQYKDLVKITPKAQKAWTELELQLQAAKAQLESVFGEALADLASPLRHLSESFGQLVRTLMQSPEVQRVIRKLGRWIDELATKMKKVTEEDIKEFIKEIKGWLPTMEQFKSAMKDFVEILQAAVSILRFIKDLVPAGSSMGTAATAGGATGIHGFLERNVPFLSDQNLITQGRKLLGLPPAAAPTSPTTSNTPSSTSPGGRSGLGFNIFGGGSGLSGGVAGPGSFAPNITGPTSSFGPGMFNFGNWSGAANKMVPPPPGGGGFMGDRFGNWKTGPTGASSPGPQSMNNWQMNRVANLVVRNVPGSNLFMSAAGMTG
jgi:methyl-accepting chemotaxis protein